MSNKKNNTKSQKIKMTAKILLGIVLSVVCFGFILNLGDNLKIPVTPCFYMGTTENIQPAKPCIDAISWQNYQILLVVLIGALTWGWYKLLNRSLFKFKK